MDPVGAFDQLTIEDPDDPVGNFFSTIWFDTEWHKVKGYCDPHAESYDSIHDYPDVRIPQSVLGDRRWSPEQIDARGDELCRRPLEHLDTADVCMDSTKLKGFLGNRPLWITELHKPHMSFGTWTEALDVMREKYDTEWSRPNKWGKVDDKLKGLNIGGRLWEASGAECSTMTRMAYARAFSIPPGGWPKINGKYSHEGFWQAQHYISHEQDVNPCRDV
ncbi:hypothetical protein K4K56_005471 [Colletotrichum sp. SAR 10_98]|nr:hypothetical protein K4K56_005471 [Colletotrichum sp. SAR 10_98]